MQLYIPADIYTDLQTWCYGPRDPVPDLPDRAWYVLRGQVFGLDFESTLSYLRFGNPRFLGIRLITYDAAKQQVCAVGMARARTPTDWLLTYYFASPGARKCRVFETATSSLMAWLVREAERQAVDVRLEGQTACEEDACQLAFAYRASPAGRLWVELDEMTRG